MRCGYARANALNASLAFVRGTIAATLVPMNRLTRALLVMPVAIASPLAAELPSTLQQQVEAVLQAAAPGTRYGLVVVDQDGTELVAINPDQRFIPASNTKMFTTAAAFWSLADLATPDVAGGTAVRIEQSDGARDVVLEGHGDAWLSSAPDCTTDCLATLADAVAARTRVVRDVVGDDSRYPDQRWSPGMSWNNIPTKSGTATSALTLDDNELPVQATPAAVGKPPLVTLPSYYTVENRALTVPSGGNGDRVRPRAQWHGRPPDRHDRGRCEARGTAPRHRRSRASCGLGLARDAAGARRARDRDGRGAASPAGAPATTPRSAVRHPPHARRRSNRSRGLRPHRCCRI